MSFKMKKVIGTSALGVFSLVELTSLQPARATPVNFTGTTVSEQPGCGSDCTGETVTITITVDGASGTYRITGATYGSGINTRSQNYLTAYNAIPLLTSRTIAATTAPIQAVTNATGLSTAWNSSLGAALAAAAAAVPTQRVGSLVATPTATSTATATPTATATSTATATPTATATSTATATPTPTDTTVPAPTPTDTTVIQQFVPAPGPVVSPGGIPVPYFAPLNFQSLIFASIPNFNAYISQISSAQSQLNGVTGTTGAVATALASAKSALTALKSQVTTEQSQYASIAGTVQNGAAILNGQFAQLVAGANQAISDYYVAVQNAAAAFYSKALAAAAAIPTPTVTVTATATVTAMVTVTATPTQPQFNLAVGTVIKKSFTCVKTLFGVTTTKVIKAAVVKCPLGYKLKKAV